MKPYPLKLSVWAFDLGKASIGEAVRQRLDFPHKASLLIPAEFAETTTAANRRRMWRTRIAHRQRERWLEQVWTVAGLAVLYGRNRDPQTGAWKAGTLADQRLEREFAEPGDDTCYTSCLLRIKLLRGERLEPWQVFKALHSAIQKRGYDKIPWAVKEARRAGKSAEDLEKEEQKKDPNYVAAVNKWGAFKAAISSDFRFPCYFDAWKMGLWDPAAPEQLQSRITHNAQSTRNIRFDRADVEREIKQLANTAATLLPALAAAFKRIRADGWTQTAPTTDWTKHFPVRAETFGDFLCYGPAGIAYSSFYPESRERFGLHLGSADDWMGALGQKIPRFDNRILEDCVLIPRFHVCKADIRKNDQTGDPVPDSLLAAEVTFLMKLKNILVADPDGQRKLRPDEITEIFSAVCADVAKVKADAKDWPQKIADCFSLTETDWARAKGIKELELRPLPGHTDLKAPKDTGRSGFSRPALRLLKELILSGKQPKEFHDEHLAKLDGNTNPMKGLVTGDLRFLLDMGESWEAIHIPAQKLEALAARHTEDGCLDVDGAVTDLLGGIKDPVVRHRLGVFATRLRELWQRFGMPGEVVLEFVREDFMGPKRKAELLQFQRDREKARKEAREKAREAGAQEKSAALKYELFKDQGCMCLYCGQALFATRLEEYEIEHIVPRSQGGPDAMVNFVLAHRQCNEEKDEQTPFQWKHGKEGWDGYKAIVESRRTTLRNKKVQLLLREDAPQLVERYTALAETAWISKLAQTIVSLFFGWKNGIDSEGHKRVTVISGGLTARVRRKYRLNSLLNPCPEAEDPFLWEEKCEKNRSDDRHHALDAMVISFIPGWTRDPKKEGFFRFPEEVHRELFDREISQVKPRYICVQRPALEETFYGHRVVEGSHYIVGREDLFSLGVKRVGGKDVIRPVKDINPKRIVDGSIRREVEQFLADNLSLTLEQWRTWCMDCRLGENGPPVVKVLVTKSKPNSLEEYAVMGKKGDAGRQHYKRAATHAGYFVYTRSAPAKGQPARKQIAVQPVYAFESKAAVEARLRQLSGVEIIDLFWSNCQIVLDNSWEFKGEVFPAGEYTLKSLWKQGNAVLKHPVHGLIGSKPKHNAPIPLGILVLAGMRRLRSPGK